MLLSVTKKRLKRWSDKLGRTHSRLVSRWRWYAVLSAALDDFMAKDLRYHNYQFTFYSFLGVMALFVAVSSLLGFLAESEVKRQLIEGMEEVMPILRGPDDGSVNIFREYRGWMGAISLLFLLWTSTNIFVAMERGFNVIFGLKARKYGRSLMVGLLMVLVIGALFLLTLEVQLSFNGLWGELFEERGAGYYAGVAVAKPLIALSVDFLMFFFIYRVVTGVHSGFKHCATAAGLAGGLFLAGQYLLSFVLVYLYRVPEEYGSLANGIIVIMWMQWTGLITFYGAEVINALRDDSLVRRYVERTIESTGGSR